MTDEIISGEALDREIAAFDRSRHIVFESLARELQIAAAAPGEAKFAVVVGRAQKVLGLTDLKMSVMFKVSRPTINRWINGVSAPHTLLRKAVFDTLIAEVRQSLKRLRVTN